ncbi:hypothetical protein [Phycicoccus endophyticus]|nr:hypothetical protein [Phycicoccus endophyticus]
MQSRWESYLTRAEQEAPKVKEHLEDAPGVAEQARHAAGEAKARYESDSSTTTVLEPGQQTTSGGSGPAR